MSVVGCRLLVGCQLPVAGCRLAAVGAPSLQNDGKLQFSVPACRSIQFGSQDSTMERCDNQRARPRPDVMWSDVMSASIISSTWCVVPVSALSPHTSYLIPQSPILSFSTSLSLSFSHLPHRHRHRHCQPTTSSCCSHNSSNHTINYILLLCLASFCNY